MPACSGGDLSSQTPQPSIGRHRIYYHWLWNNGLNVMDNHGNDLRAPERWEMLHKTPYTVMVGTRLRRIREGRQMTQDEVATKTRRKQGGPYSQGYLSRLERGYANAPLYSYVDFADTYELDPARLMGPEDADKEVGDAELALVKFLRHLGIPPDEAMARLARGESR